MAKRGREGRNISKNETQEEREARAIAEFQKRQRASAIASATDAELVGPPRPIGMFTPKEMEDIKKETERLIPGQNSSVYSSRAEGGYQGLANIVRKMGVDPKDLNPEIWNFYNKTLDGVEELARARVSESDPEQAKKIERDIDLLTERFFSKDTTSKFKEAAEEVLKNQTTTAQPQAKNTKKRVRGHIQNQEPPVVRTEAIGIPVTAPEATPAGPADTVAPAVRQHEAEVQTDIDTRIPDRPAEAAAPATKRDFLTNAEVDGLLGRSLGERGASTENIPTLTNVVGEGSHEKNPWAMHGDKRVMYITQLHELYPIGAIPNEAMDQLIDLCDTQEKNFKEGAKDNQDKYEQTIEGFIAKQREFVEDKKRQIDEGLRVHERDSSGTVKPDAAVPITVNPEDAPPGMGANAKEGKGAGETAESFLKRLKVRSKELDAQAKEMGITEKSFRKLGELYNKAGWKTKLAVGLGFGIGAGISSAALLPEVLAVCVGGIIAQRTAGLASMYLKYEKNARLEDKWGKEKAMGKAMAYSVAMTGAMLGLAYAAKELSETEFARPLREWLHAKLGHAGEVSPVPQRAEAPTAETPPSAPVETPAEPPETTPEVPKIPETPATPEPATGAEPIATKAAVMPELQPIQATSGKGYEWMMKRMWEQLQEKQIALPDNINPDSDLAKLLAADKDSIDLIVHQIASDPNHRFYNPDGTSARIILGSQMTINAEGNVEIGGAVKAPEGVPTTPPIEAGEATRAENVARLEEAIQALIQKEQASDIVPPDISPEGIEDRHLGEAAEAFRAEHMTTSEPSTPVPEFAVNRFGVEIATSEPHVYTGENGQPIIFGGTSEMQAKMAREYLSTPGNEKSVVYVASEDKKYTIAWQRSPDGTISPIGPVETRSWIGFKKWLEAPVADQLRKLIK